MLKIAAWLFLVVLVFTALSCSSPDESELPLRAPGLSTPVVTGLRITGIEGPDELAIWGQPSDSPSPTGGSGGSLPTRYSLSTPYPNPFDGVCVIGFALPRETAVSLWIVRARWVAGPASDVMQTGGGTVFAPQTVASVELMRNEAVPAGNFRFNWDGRNAAGSIVEAGFYRLYFQAGELLFWKDIFLYWSYDDLPPDLLTLVQQRGRFSPFPHHP